MPQSLSFMLIHVIFSTKDRRPLIHDAVQDSLHAYLATVVRDRKCDCFRTGGTADHVHLAIRLHPTMQLAKLLADLKSNSSRWMKEQGFDKFGWQRGYGAFSVSPADAGSLMRYIAEQKTHHQKRDFQAEMRAFLDKYHVAFDEKYVWDYRGMSRAYSPSP